ncbi:MAG: FtsX-like permease family protein, partial [Acidobacteriota bacterium]
GSSRTRIVRQLLIESLIIAVAGASAALVVAMWCVRLFIAALPPDTPLSFSATARVLDTRVLMATAITAILTGIAFGALPALRATGRAVLPGIRNDSSRGSSRSRLGRAFVIVQVTLAAVLLITAGLLLRTLRNARSVNPGFDPRGKVVASIDLARQGYSKDAMPAVWARILEKVTAMPSIRGAALARTVPVQNSGMRISIVIEGYDPPPGTYPNVDMNIVTPGYFRTLGVPIIRGRDLAESDIKGGRDVAVINRAMADEYWPGRDPIGKYIGDVNAEVVGIVANVRERSLRAPAAPAVYRPLAQLSMSGMTLLVAGDGQPAALTAGLTSAVRQVDPDLPLFQVWTLEQKLGYALAQERLMAAMVGAFSLLALLLSAGGLYSVVAYATQLRRREFGIRMALGAERGRILRTVLKESVVLTLTGLVFGLGIAAGVTRFAQSLLFGVSPLDPMTFLIAGAVLLAAGLAAGQLPAIRAMSTDPANVLRHE